METSIVAHLENASSQTEESKIAANFQTVYAKQFLLQKLYPNVNGQSESAKTKIHVWSSRVQVFVSEYLMKLFFRTNVLDSFFLTMSSVFSDVNAQICQIFNDQKCDFGT